MSAGLPPSEPPKETAPVRVTCPTCGRGVKVTKSEYLSQHTMATRTKTTCSRGGMSVWLVPTRLWLEDE